MIVTIARDLEFTGYPEGGYGYLTKVASGQQDLDPNLVAYLKANMPDAIVEDTVEPVTTPVEPITEPEETVAEEVSETPVDEVTETPTDEPVEPAVETPVEDTVEPVTTP